MASGDFLIRSQATRGDEVVLNVYVPPDLVFFEGHFPNDPILPGIAQVLWLVHRRARAAFAGLGPEVGMQRLKFERAIGPNQELTVRMQRVLVGDGIQIKFRIERGEDTCTSGVIVYGAV